jgi:SPP1 family predicted phage head-tail adaptor
MGASRCDRRITVQYAEKPWPKNTKGDKVPAFEDIARPWAHKRGLSAREALQAQQPVGLEEFNFIVRDDSDTRQITNDEAWRIVADGKTYDVVHAGDLADVDPKEPPRRWRAIRVRGRAERTA